MNLEGAGVQVDNVILGPILFEKSYFSTIKVKNRIMCKFFFFQQTKTEKIEKQKIYSPFLF